MPDFVLRSLRKEAMKALKKACLKGMKVEDAAGVWRVVEMDGEDMGETALRGGLERIGDLKAMGSGGVLVFGSTATDGDAMEGEDEEVPVAGDVKSRSLMRASTSQLPDFITLPIQGSQVPIFDLTTLLARSDIDELRQHHPRFRETALFFRPVFNIPVDAMLALWRLKGYVMYDRDI